MYLLIRALHVLTGALWVGFAVFGAWFLMPAVQDLGPDAPKMNVALQKRGFIVAFPVIAGLAILTGVYLYWSYTGGFKAEVSRTHGAMAFGTGGLLSVIAFVLGGALIGRNTARAAALAQQASQSPDAAARGQLLEQAARLRKIASTANHVVAVLLILTIVLMSVGLFL